LSVAILHSTASQLAVHIPSVIIWNFVTYHKNTDCKTVMELQRRWLIL